MTSYRDRASLAGGYGRWHDQGHPTVKPAALHAEQQERYRRHLVIPEVGEEGQARLLAAKVLLLGAGGLGSPAALYLAAAGVGTLGIVDSDVVDLSNLQRQVLHSTRMIGKGAPLVGRLLAFDALETRFHELRLRRDPACPVCRPGAEVTLTDEPPACAGEVVAAPERAW